MKEIYLLHVLINISIKKASYSLAVTFSPLSTLSAPLILPWGKAGQLQHFWVGQSVVWVPLTTRHIWPAGFALSVFLSDGVWPFASLLGSRGEGEMAVWVAGPPSGRGPGSGACLLGDRRHRSASLASFFSLRPGGPPSPVPPSAGMGLKLTNLHTHTHTHTHTYIYIYIYIYTHTHTHTNNNNKVQCFLYRKKKKEKKTGRDGILTRCA